MRQSVWSVEAAEQQDNDARHHRHEPEPRSGPGAVPEHGGEADDDEQGDEPDHHDDEVGREWLSRVDREDRDHDRIRGSDGDHREGAHVLPPLSVPRLVMPDRLAAGLPMRDYIGCITKSI